MQRSPCVHDPYAAAWRDVDHTGHGPGDLLATRDARQRRHRVDDLGPSDPCARNDRERGPLGNKPQERLMPLHDLVVRTMLTAFSWLSLSAASGARPSKSEPRAMLPYSVTVTPANSAVDRF